MSTSTTDRKPSKGKLVRITSASAAVLAAAACGLYFTGTYGSWRDDAEPAARLCDGMVPQGELSQFLGMRELTPEDVITDRSTGEPQECSVRPRREGAGKYYDEVDITVSKNAGSRDLLRNLARQMSDSSTQAVSPIGSGWRGVLGADTHVPRAAVVMLCGGGGEENVVVDLTARHLGAVQEAATAEQRTQLARLATRTAVVAADRAGCKAPLGHAIKEVPAPIPTSMDSAVATPPGRATGTCAGVSAATWEATADSLAPIEDCFLLDKDGKPAYRLAAYYGPYVEDGYVATYKRGDSGKFRGSYGGSDGLYWSSAGCPAQGGTAFFTAETLHTDDGSHTHPDPALQQASLRKFAERSAKAHGCRPAKPVTGEAR